MDNDSVRVQIIPEVYRRPINLSRQVISRLDHKIFSATFCNGIFGYANNDRFTRQEVKERVNERQS